ncbi:MAG: hypothetical protein K8T89_21975 [Planctomycetes bacterium]|nr:hypothetical protein [Planctomycetota bacterium]
MAVFYVLPPRTALGECLASLLRPMVPGVTISRDSCENLVDALVAGSPDADESYVVHRDDLPNDEDLNTALRDGFGAEVGDHVVQVSLGARIEQPRVKTWKLEAV